MAEAYVNYIDSEKFGRIWFRVWLRNWWALGETAEQNRQRGPLCELLCDDYLLCSHGKTVDEAVAGLERLVELYAEYQDKLPISHGRRRWSPISAMRLWWMFRGRRRERVTRENCEARRG